MTMLDALQEIAKPSGLSVRERGKGHFQIHGRGLLVNYYPFAKKESAYIAGTTRRFNRVTPEQAVQMALAPPPIATPDRKARRKNTYLPVKMAMFRRDAGNGIETKCHWCKVPLTLKTATLDHRIPLHRGGLDNDNNRVLACQPCNNKRGHDMPELAK